MSNLGSYLYGMCFQWECNVPHVARNVWLSGLECLETFLISAVSIELHFASNVRYIHVTYKTNELAAEAVLKLGSAVLCYFTCTTR